MKYSSSETLLSRYLHSKANKPGIPISGSFELTARCNFNCKMCYVHQAGEDGKAKASELSAEQWLAFGEAACRKGMVFLLLTGGEPFVRSDFGYIYTELKKMGLMVSINSNASLIDKDMLDFLRREPPVRMNITLYGAGNEAYERVCGRPMFDKVISNIKALREIGIPVKLNATLTPDNVNDCEKLFELANELGVYIQASAYMFPPMRRASQRSFEGGERLSAEEAARISVISDRLRFAPEDFMTRAENIKNGIRCFTDDECQQARGREIGCRAGKSSFWLTWDGKLMPCGLLTEPSADALELGFEAAWEQIHSETSAIVLPSKCSTCSVSHVCGVCAARCLCETGAFDKAPEYLCEFTNKCVEFTQEEYKRMKED